MFFPTNHIILNLRRTIMRRENIFKEIKRITSQFIETEYWYRFRKLPNYWYDDEQNIYSPLKKKIPARDLLLIKQTRNIETTDRLHIADSQISWLNMVIPGGTEGNFLINLKLTYFRLVL